MCTHIDLYMYLSSCICYRMLHVIIKRKLNKIIVSPHNYASRFTTATRPLECIKINFFQQYAFRVRVTLLSLLLTRFHRTCLRFWTVFGRNNEKKIRNIWFGYEGEIVLLRKGIFVRNQEQPVFVPLRDIHSFRVGIENSFGWFLISI